METLEFFKKLRDTSGEIVTAMENEDEAQLEQAMGKFVVLMLKADALKG
ncbi:hypothetical protein P4S93_18090 [Aneurinibacillus thermoaerophilus]|uniref:Uncharacterized protein n=1 Tax=Aneurinibacillus thermoaerophilus TaxID=143495 RepID=A0A1G8ETP3_ANETH|nr:hypothetical protein [Aneurinibacillus thermoaerophilus]MED0757399.1 hypothetical protein [Aneurinibacillus thermoaerophilus]MED0762631.1 hypothetical protein [Aneurinibacillus thermoaerophilus]SDH73273.1 hypothetical protein SAMN04489735_104825 [Aneurinibacillus thermoaerophilus]